MAQHRIDCQWRRAGKHHSGAVSPAAERTLQHHVDELRALDWAPRTSYAGPQRPGCTPGHPVLCRGLYTPGTVLLNPAAVPGLADALPANVTLHEQTPCSGWICRAARWWPKPAGQRACAGSCCWRPMALRSSWVCLAVPGGGDVSAGHFGSLTARSRPSSSRLGAPEGWGVTPASAVTGATLRYTDDHRILVRQVLNMRRISASAPRA